MQPCVGAGQGQTIERIPVSCFLPAPLFPAASVVQVRVQSSDLAPPRSSSAYAARPLSASRLKDWDLLLCLGQLPLVRLDDFRHPL